MKIHCVNFRDWYPRLMENSLAGREKISARQHLSDCEKCRDLAGQIESAIEQNVFSISDTKLQDQILSRISTKSSEIITVRSGYNLYLLRLTAAAAVLLIGFFAGRQLSVQTARTVETPEILLAAEFSLSSGPDESSALFLND